MASQLDLTQGSLSKKLLTYAFPVILSSLLQSAYSIADTIIVGRYVGAAGISAVNNGSQLMMILTQIIMGLCTGGNVLMGQYYGAKDHKSRHDAGTTLFTSSLILGILAAILFLTTGRAMLTALEAPALDEATTYLSICALGIVSICGYNALSAAIRAVGNSKMPLYCIIATAAVNVVGDILLVGVFPMGVAGAAIATVASQTASFLICLIYVLKNRELFHLRLGINGHKLLLTMKLGIPSAVQWTVAGVSWLTVTFLVNQYGVDASAAAGIIVKIKDVCQLFTSAMASASATMIAQCLGAGKYDRASKTVHMAMRIAIGVSIVIVLFVELAAPLLISIFTQDQAVIDLGASNLRIEIIAQIFYASFLVYNSLAIGAGHSLFALGSSFLNCILVRLVLAILFARFWGLTGVYIACLIAPASSVPLGYIYERTGIWKRSLSSK